MCVLRHGRVILLFYHEARGTRNTIEIIARSANMTPLFACFPVCMTFTVIVFLALVVVVFDLANRIPGDDEPTAPPVPRDPKQKMGPPPWWVFPLMLLAVAAFMAVCAWIWPE
ncbi:hypothetical protein VT84_22075 [Gemmata sp. SH-PL17]|nr:hypothetical protein VT84_22075 [Gemmata sp. SH-PL17]